MEDLRDSDPRNVGPYRLISRIGTGGMGVVYLAEDAAGQRVALKLVRPELVEDQAFRVRFRREVEAGQRVGGICTAKYIAADLESDHPYLVTEYVEGGSLAEFVAHNGPLKDEQLIGLAVGLAEALVAMHSVGVIHRDLKPTNVLMGTRGPRVVDFGISHAADETALTQSGIIMGSPAWMAPEQAQGEPTTPAVDVFSWGATVAFAATGRSPFGEGRPDAVIYRVVHEAPDLAGLDPRLQTLVSAALSKDASRRPAPDALLLEVVKTAMAGGAPPGGSLAMATVALDRTWKHEQPPPPERPFLRRNAWWLAVAAVIVLAAAAGGILLATSKNPASHVANGTTSTTSAPASTTSTSALSTTTSTTNATSSLVTLPVDTCNTSYGDTNPNTPPPSTMQVTLPSSMSGTSLSYYALGNNEYSVLAPAGWDCSGSVGADGSSGMTVVPPSEANALADSTVPSASSMPQAIYVTNNGACQGCGFSQTCGIFAQANTQYANSLGGCTSPPASETDTTLTSTVVGFLDPPGVSGTGQPSGGSNPANGVITFALTNGNQANSDLMTCELPDTEHQLCTATLNDFIRRYWPY